MKKQKVILLLASVGLIIIIGLGAHKYTEQAIQAQKLNERYQIYPVPIPSNLSFANEAVPLNQFDIKERLDRELLVNTYWQSNTMLILKRSKKYFKVIEPILKKNGIPEDFKYLAVAESGFHLATSSAGAQGIWQFMERSAKYYGLTVTDHVDERLHLERSTEAACRYLKEAYETFGNWTLAAASYNRGITGIRNAMDEQKVNTYYDLHLNSETARYIPRILAFKAIIEDPESYGFYIEQKDYYSSTPSRKISLKETVTDLASLAAEHQSTYHEIKTLNPWILGNQIMVEEDTEVEILLPAKSK